MMSPSVIRSVNGDGTDHDDGTHHYLITPSSNNGNLINNNNNNNEQRSQFSSLSDGENFEWNGILDSSPRLAEQNMENEERIINSSGGGVVNEERINHQVSSRSPSSNNNNRITRNAWLRTSLRRSSPNNNNNNNNNSDNSSPNRRWGSFRHNTRRSHQTLNSSNGLASNLYRSSSFNSSGRSSICDTTDEMYSDASLEEDVQDLHHKFQVLQQQVGVLQDSANHSDERYTRVKSENAALQTRIHILEEQLRDMEMRCDEKLQEEQRRAKELVQRIEREKQLQLENAAIRLQNSEAESTKLDIELQRYKMKLEKFEKIRDELQSQIQDLQFDLTVAKDDVKHSKDVETRVVKEQNENIQLLEDFSKEIERLKQENRTPASSGTNSANLRLEELHEEMQQLRAENAFLRDSNEELQANLLQASLETGRILANNNNNNNNGNGVDGNFSLAQELDRMSQDEVHQALKEQQEVNRKLRSYIEGILLNIVENHPQLLEVKYQAKNGLKK